jgi:hypothetical protein
MILIDRNKTKQDIVLTLAEKTTVDEHNYLLHLINDADKSAYSIYLNDSLVSRNSRYDFYSVATSDFKDFSDGYYIYQIHQDGLDSDVIEVGKLLIVSAKEDVQIITPIRKEEYLIYK